MSWSRITLLNSAGISRHAKRYLIFRRTPRRGSLQQRLRCMSVFGGSFEDHLQLLD